MPVASEPDAPDAAVPVAVEKPDEAVLDAPSCPPAPPPSPGSAVGLLPSDDVDTAWAVGALPDSLLLLLSPLPPPPSPLPPLPVVGDGAETAGGVAAPPPAAAALVGGRTVVKIEVALTSTQLRS